MKFEKQVSLKWAIALVLIACLVSSSIVYYVFAVSPSSAFTISGGIYPGAPSYTVWYEGGYYFAKDANGEIDYSGTNASQIINYAITATYANGGGTVFLKEVELPDDVTIGNNIRVIEEYQGIQKVYWGNWGIQVAPPISINPRYSLSLGTVDIERLESIYAINLTAWSSNNGFGCAIDLKQKCFYVVFGDSINRRSIIAQIDKYGSIVKSALKTDRRYFNPIVANGGKLYACEFIMDAETTTNAQLDELSKTDFSLVQNIVSFPQATMNRFYGFVKNTDTQLLLYGGAPKVGAKEHAKYAVVNLQTKAYTVYAPSALGQNDENLWSGRKIAYNGHIYCGSHGAPMFLDINPSDWSYVWRTLTVAVPTSADVALERDGLVLFNTYGAGGVQGYTQKMQWWNPATSSSVEISEYFQNNNVPGQWGIVYFKQLDLCLVGLGATRYFNGPAHQTIYDLNTAKWHDISPMFDLLKTSYDTTTAAVTPTRLSIGCDCSCTIDDDSTGGKSHPGGFTDENGLNIFLTCMFKGYLQDTTTYWCPVLIIGTLSGANVR
jgi:hypothetical protein